MEFILHIGLQKTGSSSLQRALAGNRGVLRRHGLVYPEMSDPALVQQKRLLKVLNGFAPQRAGLTEDWLERFRAETADANICILSDESFWSLPKPEKLSSMIPRDRTRVVMYVREPVAHVSSLYRQKVKRHILDTSLMEFAQSYRPCIFPAAERWAANFGRENVVIRLYDRDDGSWEIVSDFANLIELKNWEISSVSNENECNPSLAGNLLFMKRALNRIITHEENRAIRNEIRELRYLDRTFRGKIPVDQEIVDFIVLRCQEDLEGLERRFGVPIRPRDKPIEAPPCPDLHNLDRDFARILAFARERNGQLAPLLDRKAGVFAKAIEQELQRSCLRR